RPARRPPPVGPRGAPVSPANTRVVAAATHQGRVAELGAEIAADYAGREPLLLGVLKGAVPFTADLSRHLPPGIDIDFLGLTRFGDRGRVGIAVDSGTSLAGRDVIVVEDIVDTGLTLSYLLGLLETREPASLETVALVDKVQRRIVDVPLRYRGFEVGDEFLVGYGLDWEGRFRNTNELWAVLDLAAMRDDPLGVAAGVFEDAGDRLLP
ncbi:MAG: phosphoribosyltransferase family protein, partial [Acidimicrobiia bacterium]|nr:phosphoribosyltransferase family protein [Acidimicrobiia bacterium]